MARVLRWSLSLVFSTDVCTLLECPLFLVWKRKKIHDDRLLVIELKGTEPAIFCRQRTCRRNCILCSMLAIDQGQKCTGGFEMAKYLQQRLNLWNVAPERQKTAFGAFCSRDKKARRRICDRLLARAESRNNFSQCTRHYTPGSFGGLQQLTWLWWLQHCSTLVTWSAALCMLFDWLL